MLHRDRSEELQPVGAAAHELVDRMLGVRHEPHHVAGLVADPGDVAQRAVGVLAGRVAQDDPDPVRVGRVVPARRVLDRDREPLTDHAAGEGALTHDLDMHLPAEEAQPDVG